MCRAWPALFSGSVVGDPYGIIKSGPSENVGASPSEKFSASSPSAARRVTNRRNGCDAPRQSVDIFMHVYDSSVVVDGSGERRLFRLFIHCRRAVFFACLFVCLFVSRVHSSDR